MSGVCSTAAYVSVVQHGAIAVVDRGWIEDESIKPWKGGKASPDGRMQYSGRKKNSDRTAIIWNRQTDGQTDKTDKTHRQQTQTKLNQEGQTRASKPLGTLEAKKGGAKRYQFVVAVL